MFSSHPFSRTTRLGDPPFMSRRQPHDIMAENSINSDNNFFLCHAWDPVFLSRISCPFGTLSAVKRDATQVSACIDLIFYTPAGHRYGSVDRPFSPEGETPKLGKHRSRKSTPSSNYLGRVSRVQDSTRALCENHPCRHRHTVFLSCRVVNLPLSEIFP